MNANPINPVRPVPSTAEAVADATASPTQVKGINTMINKTEDLVAFGKDNLEAGGKTGASDARAHRSRPNDADAAHGSRANIAKPRQPARLPLGEKDMPHRLCLIRSAQFEEQPPLDCAALREIPCQRGRHGGS